MDRCSLCEPSVYVAALKSVLGTPATSSYRRDMTSVVEGDIKAKPVIVETVTRIIKSEELIYLALIK